MQKKNTWKVLAIIMAVLVLLFFADVFLALQNHTFAVQGWLEGACQLFIDHPQNTLVLLVGVNLIRHYLREKNIIGNKRLDTAITIVLVIILILVFVIREYRIKNNEQAGSTPIQAEFLQAEDLGFQDQNIIQMESGQKIGYAYLSYTADFESGLLEYSCMRYNDADDARFRWERMVEEDLEYYNTGSSVDEDYVPSERTELQLSGDLTQTEAGKAFQWTAARGTDVFHYYILDGDLLMSISLKAEAPLNEEQQSLIFAWLEDIAAQGQE